MHRRARLGVGQFVRLAHPDMPGFYYDSTDSVRPWKKHGYKVWTITEWRQKFGRQNLEGRYWEQFGYRIPLYDDHDS